MQTTDLNLLAALDALLAHESVTGAAEAMGLSVSAMSRTLARIRDVTGDPILAPAGRGLVPTPRAIALRERVHAALTEAQALLGPDEGGQLGDRARVLTIRADDSVAAALGPELLQRTRVEVPGLSLVFASEGAEDVAALREGRIDLDIGVQGALGPEIRTSRLFDDERIVLVRDLRRRRRRKMKLEELAEVEHIDVSRRGHLRGPVDDLLERNGLERKVRAVVPTQLAAAMLVAQSDAVSLVSKRFAETLVGLLPVRAIAPPAPLDKVAISLAWHPRHDGDAVHAWLRDSIRDVVASVRARGRVRRNRRGPARS